MCHSCFGCAGSYKKVTDIESVKDFSWKQTGGPTAVIQSDNRSRTFSFVAPYVRGKDLSNRLSFELTADYNVNKSTIYTANIMVKRVQRAIIFQGGVALGAYEAGVFRALVEKITEEDRKRGLNERPLFDIIAGTSIGAMNASIIASHIINENGSWDNELVDKLERFWNYQASPTISDFIFINHLFVAMWDLSHNMQKTSKQVWNNVLTGSISPFAELSPYTSTIYHFWRDYFIDGWYIPATGEAARRYYSAKEFKNRGTPHVASGIIPWSIYGKFFDFADNSNFLPRPDNKHLSWFSLKETLQQFTHFPVKSTAGQPRFLLVTVDVQTGDAVTFDSYSNKAKYHNDTNSFIRTKNGIETDHVLASGTFPRFYDYPNFEVESKNEMTKTSDKERRIFWDGGIKSNTPLRELIQAHTDYWREKTDHGIPDLEVYIADLWPSEIQQQPVSFDNDFVNSRNFDITFGDRTDYDEKVANMVSDYVDVAKQLRGLARRKGASKDEIDEILDRRTRSKSRIGHEARKYKNLLDDRFKLLKVVRIDRKDTGNEVADKVFDYTLNTIEKLMKEGYHDTLVQIAIQNIKDGIGRLANKSGKNNGEDSHIESLKKELTLIQHGTKIEDGQSVPSVIQMENLLKTVRSMPNDVHNGTSLVGEKMSLLEKVGELRAILTARA